MNAPAPSLHRTLTLSLVESKIGRIRQHANEIESFVGLIAELRQISPMSTPCADLRLAAHALRVTALKLDKIAEEAAEAS